jgi:hypothetical protein
MAHTALRLAVVLSSLLAVSPALARGRPRHIVRFTPDGPELEPLGGGRYAYSGRYVDAILEADGTLRFSPTVTQVLGWLTLDATRAEVLAEEQWVADETFEVRFGKAQVARERDIVRSLESLGPRLALLWSDAELTAAERRQLLFALWDEAAEPDDPELAVAGARAREIIEEFVRAVAPPGELGFTQEELNRFNACRPPNGPWFDPYAPLALARAWRRTQ